MPCRSQTTSPSLTTIQTGCRTPRSRAGSRARVSWGGLLLLLLSCARTAALWARQPAAAQQARLPQQGQAPSVRSLSIAAAAAATPAAVPVRTPEEIAGIREACRIGRLVLDKAHAAVRPGVTTDEIDRVVSRRRGLLPRQQACPSWLADRGGSPAWEGSRPCCCLPIGSRRWHRLVGPAITWLESKRWAVIGAPRLPLAPFPIPTSASPTHRHPPLPPHSSRCTR